MRKNFERALDVTLVYEGGYSNDPRDPGGPTNMGVTQKTLAAWRGEPVSAADVKALTLDEARKIYKAQYWDRVRADRLPTGVDFAVFDYAQIEGALEVAEPQAFKHRLCHGFGHHRRAGLGLMHLMT
jgi:lysozyme family protein